eukprot:g2434.t1
MAASHARIVQLLDQIEALKRENGRLRRSQASVRPNTHISSSDNANRSSSCDADGDSATCDDGALFAFGVIADVQYCNIPDGTNFTGTTKRYFRGALDCLRRAIDEWQAPRPACAPSFEFVAQLGDIIDNQCQMHGQTAADFAAVKQELDRLPDSIKLYHLIGNHELYNFSRAELREKLHTAPPPHCKEYYAFEPAASARWRFIVLDGYQEAIIGHDEGSAPYESALALLRANNPNDVLSSCDWLSGLEARARRFAPFNGGLGAEQRCWLRAELQGARRRGQRVVIFSHALLHPLGGGEDWCTTLWDVEQVADIIAEAAPTVAAVFAGHDHQGGYAVDESGVHHITMPSPLNCGSSDLAHANVTVFEDRLRVDGRGIVPSRDIMLL